MSVPYSPPKHLASSYNCPHCHAFSMQIWSSYTFHRPDNSTVTYQIEPLTLVICKHCNKYSLWHFGKMIYPSSGNTPMPSGDLPDEIKTDYEEARNIVTSSPRGATALLRLVVQKLCAYLGESGKDINADIKSLVNKGLSPKVQQALDIVRVIGNEAVHPGQIDLTDDIDTATTLFGLINLIVEDRITRPREIEAMYATLPANKLKGIEARDKK